MSLAFRQAQHSDTWWVVTTWLESFRLSHEAGLILTEDWYEVMKPQVRKLLGYPTVDVVVAYNPSNEDLKTRDYGWLAYERAPDLHLPLVLYAYVKEPFRREGLATRLLKEAEIDGSFKYACKTEDGERWLRRRSAKWTPRAARRRR